MVDLTLPAGKYILTSEVSLQNIDQAQPSLVWCGLVGGAPALTQLAAGSFGHISKTTRASLSTETQVTMKCGLGTNLTGATQRVAAEITAIKVDQLSVK
jgi:hypothetical protein